MPHLEKFPEPHPIHQVTVGTKGGLRKTNPLFPDTQDCLTRRYPLRTMAGQLTAPPTAASQPVFPRWENEVLWGPQRAQLSCQVVCLLTFSHLLTCAPHPPTHPGSPLGVAPIPPSNPKRS